MTEATFEEGEDGKRKFKNVSMSFSKRLTLNQGIDSVPVVSKKGLIVGPEYENWVKS